MPGADLIRPRRRAALELLLVVAVAIGVLAPGISRYSLVDPWETHYGEVARMMLASHDYVYTQWPGTNLEGQQNEGFRSKPILTFWMMAAGLHATHVAENGGYSGEMCDRHEAVQFAIRIPFVLSAIAGLVLIWWMLARLVSRRLAWLALLVIGTAPMYCLIARQAMPDMPHAACVMGAFALFVLAIEDGDRAIVPLWRRVDARHVTLGLAGGFVVVQAVYYAIYFRHTPVALWLPAMMLILLAVVDRMGWLLVRMPMLLVGGVIAFREPTPARTQTHWRYFLDVIVPIWDRHALDRYVIRAIAWPFARGRTRAVADAVLAMPPITRMRQVYLLGCYALLGVSVLAKGPPGLAVIGFVGVGHVLLAKRWRALYDGAFELKRGLALLVAIAVPWHLAMIAIDGITFITQYIFFNVIDRAAVGVDSSPGTFQMYTAQLGQGMWLWAALVPAAFASALLRARESTREGRVRFLVALWAICAMFLFSFVQTKFHHYILPALPALGILVAFLLDDLWAGRDRLHPLLALIGAAIVLFVCRDLMHEPKQWIEMFVFRYDRPWPSADPWAIDPSDGFLVLGIVAALAVLLAAIWRRGGVCALAAAGLAICLWCLHVYMPIAGTHWGMGDAMRTYYKQRSIYGETRVYFGLGELYDDWHGSGDVRTIETAIPDALQVGQPMTLTLIVKSPDERTTQQTLTLVGTATAIGDHSIDITLAPHERDKLPLQAGAPRGRPPLAFVDADRLIAFQLYWRGENFWSGEEIWNYLPDMKTSFPKTDNADFTKYINDRTRAPLGRRYFVITDTARATTLRTMLPTQRGRDSYEVIDQTSNKFALSTFVL